MGAISLNKLRRLIDLRKDGEDVDQELISNIEWIGFVLDKEEAGSLQKIDKNPKFSRLKDLIDNHESLYLVRVGIHIMKLNDDGKRQLIDKIKGKVKEKYSNRGINILNLGSTGVVFDVIDYLDTLKLKGQTKDEIITEFERILDEWERITLFITREHDKNYVQRNIEIYMKLEHPIFFVFAYGSACDVAMKTIARMNVARLIIQKNHYLFFQSTEKDKAGKVKMTWRFEKTSPSETSEFEF